MESWSRREVSAISAISGSGPQQGRALVWEVCGPVIGSPATKQYKSIDYIDCRYLGFPSSNTSGFRHRSVEYKMNYVTVPSTCRGFPAASQLGSGCYLNLMRFLRSWYITYITED